MFSECYDQQSVFSELYPAQTSSKHFDLCIMVGRGTPSLSVPPDLKSETAKLSNSAADETNPELAFSFLGLYISRRSAAIKSWELFISALCIKRSVDLVYIGGCILVLGVYERRAARQTRPIWRLWARRHSGYLGFGKVSSLAFKIPSVQPCQKFYKYNGRSNFKFGDFYFIPVLFV